MSFPQLLFCSVEETAKIVTLYSAFTHFYQASLFQHRYRPEAGSDQLTKLSGDEKGEVFKGKHSYKPVTSKLELKVSE